MLSVKNLPIFVFYLGAITTIIISITNTVETARGKKNTNMSALQTLIGIYLGLFIAVTSSFKSGKSGRSLVLPYIIGFAMYFFGNLYSLLNLGMLSDLASEIVHILGSLIVFYAYRVDSSSINLTTFLPAGFITKYTNKVTEVGDNVFGTVFKKVNSTVNAVTNLKDATEYKVRKFKTNSAFKRQAKISKAKAIKDILKSSNFK